MLCLPVLAVLAFLGVLGAACSPAPEPSAVQRAGARPGPSSEIVPTPAAASPSASSPIASAPIGSSDETNETTTTTAPPLPDRLVSQPAWAPFATTGGITLLHPAALVERVGFHQANHDGARELEPLPTTVAPATLELRDRGTPARTAADIVVDPNTEIRSPVTGTVKRAGTYTLYCHYTDSYAVIDPAAHPGWEVKLLHVVGLRVRAGQPVVAGVTVIAAHAHKLPFESQVDELAAPLPAWPHVHVEVVDPSIKDRPNPGSGCS
ncbi:MAG: hypothetical protein QOI20_2409 [Acidimicrobiaceae bacterium]|nr:hypothetical protein [Acidimicrobiaceae bacterium]